MDVIIASRRIETAICVFGGSQKTARQTHTSSIFRLKGTTSNRTHYEQQMSKRYHVGESRISWDVEANPPIYLGPSDADQTNSADEMKSPRTKNSPHLIVDDTPGGKRPGSGSASPTPSCENPDAPKMKYR